MCSGWKKSAEDRVSMVERVKQRTIRGLEIEARERAKKDGRGVGGDLDSGIYSARKTASTIERQRA